MQGGGLCLTRTMFILLGSIFPPLYVHCTERFTVSMRSPHIFKPLIIHILNMHISLLNALCMYRYIYLYVFQYFDIFVYQIQTLFFFFFQVETTTFFNTGLFETIRSILIGYISYLYFKFLNLKYDNSIR